MSRSRNYQRTRRHSFSKITRERASMIDARAAAWEINDGQREYLEHAGSTRLVYWRAWAVARMEREARTRHHRGRRKSDRRAIKEANQLFVELFVHMGASNSSPARTS